MAPHVGKLPAGIEAIDLRADYLCWLERRWRLLFKGEPCIKVVVDPGNGSWSGLATELFTRLGFECISIHDEPDGRFPNRSPDSSVAGNLHGLSSTVRQENAAVGFAWDGDGDRLAVCDDTGTVLSSEQVALLLLPVLLSDSSGEKILIDVKVSRMVKQTIEALKAVPIVERSAHCLLERAMIGQNCLFGCEYSGHYFFRELGGTDDGLFAALVVAAVVLSADEPLSRRIRRLPRMSITLDVRFPGAAAELSEIVDCLRREFPGYRFDDLDGCKLDTGHGWFLARCSVSERKISCRFEADTDANLERLIWEVTGRLPPTPRAELEASLMRWLADRRGEPVTGLRTNR